MALKSLFARVERGQSGFTLVELLVASALMVVVLLALFGLFDATQRLVPQDQERAQQLRDTETGVYQMTHELRLAYSLIATSAYAFEANVDENGQSLHVLYDCSGSSSINPSWGQCLRKLIGSGGTTQTTTPTIAAFTNTSASAGKPIFTYTTNSKGETTYVSVHVEVPAQGKLKTGAAYRITYDDGFYMRNLDV